MIKKQTYSLKVFYNNTELELTSDNFIEFRIFESLNYNIYFSELKLMSILFRDALVVTGDKIKIEITIDRSDIVKTYSFIIFEYFLDKQDHIVMTLVTDLWDKLYIKKQTKGYKDKKLNTIVEEVISNTGLKKGLIENVNVPNRLFLQLNQNYFNFLKYLWKYVEGYILFINKKNELSFSSYANILNTQQVKAYFNSTMFKVLRIDNKAVSMQFLGGLGATGYYFDWDNNDIKKYEYDVIKYGINDAYKDVKNTVMMSNPIGQDVYFDQAYSENKVKNTVLNKNMFKVFINFSINGEYDLNVGDKIEITFPLKSDASKDNNYISGEYIIFSINVSYANFIETNIVCASPFLLKGNTIWKV